MAQLELDRVLQSLTNDFNKFRASWTQTMTSVQKTFVQAEATVKGMISSSGGAAWSTLTGSLELVGIQVTRFFLPTIVMASQGLQQFAGYLRGLEPEQRAAITRFAEIAGGAAIAVTAFRLLGIKLDATTVAFGLLLVAMEKFTDWLDKKINEQWKEIAKNAGKQFTNEELKATPEYAKLAAMSEEERNKYIDEKITEARKGIADRSRKFPKGGVALAGGGPLSWIEQVTSLFGTGQMQNATFWASMQELFASGGKRQNPQGALNIPDLAGGKGIMGLLGMAFPGLKEVLDPLRGGGKMTSNAGAAPPFLRNWATEMQPRFSSIEEARKQFQIQALRSPLEQQLIMDLRQMAQDFNNEKPKSWIMDAANRIANALGFP